MTRCGLPLMSSVQSATVPAMLYSFASAMGASVRLRAADARIAPAVAVARHRWGRCFQILMAWAFLLIGFVRRVRSLHMTPKCASPPTRATIAAMLAVARGSQVGQDPTELQLKDP